MMNPKKEYFYQLDFFRTVSALLVVFYHTSFYNHFSDLHVVKNGFLGVDFFFVLSGFVIYHNYADRLGSLEQFFQYGVARFARVYPLHLLTLLIFIGLEFLKFVANLYFGIRFGELPFTASDGAAVLANLFLLTAHGTTDNLTFNAPSWSIAAEFTSYLIFGLLVLGFGARSKMFILISLLFVGLGAFTVLNLENAWMGYQIGWIRCLVGFFCGVLVYKLHARWKMELTASVGLAVEVLALGMFLVLFSLPEWFSLGRWSYLLMDLGSALFIMAFTASSSQIVKVTQSIGSGLFGKLSYGIYMWQLLILSLTGRLFSILLKYPSGYDARLGRDTVQAGAYFGDLMTLGMVAVIMVIAYYSYHYFEDPARKAIRLDNARKV